MRDNWITVHATPTPLIPTGSGVANDRSEIMFFNPGPLTVWVGKNSAQLGVTTGFPVAPSTSATFAMTGEGLWARATADQLIHPIVVGTAE